MSLVGPRLEVFISGDLPGQARYAEFVQGLVDDALAHAHIRVTDVLADPQRAEERAVIATPQLVRWFPTPVRRIIGEVYDAEELLHHLELLTSTAPPQTAPAQLPGPFSGD